MPTYLPSSGTLSMNTINTLFGRGNNLNAYRGTQYYTATAGPFTFSSGSISFSSFYNSGPTAGITPGSQNYTTPGTYSFTVPNYNTMTVMVWGGGGGSPGTTAGSGSGGYAYDGNTSSFGGYMSATGGQRGVIQNSGSGYSNPGSGSGGDINESGQAGSAAPDFTTPSYGGAAGGTAYGGGGTRTLSYSGISPYTPGLTGNSYGGGGTAWMDDFKGNGLTYKGGGGAGFSRKVFSAGSGPSAGSVISVVVGSGGYGGYVNDGGTMKYGGSGANGAVLISWA